MPLQQAYQLISQVTGMSDMLTVIIPAYNPNPERLELTLAGLKSQTLDFKHWELIIIDNNSSPAINTDISWHPNHQMIAEARQGLTYARTAGFEQAKGEVIVMVDDDNILHPDYLENVRAIFQADSHLGAAGGKSLPHFEAAPPSWLQEFHANLALRNPGDQVITVGWENLYPACAPVGAGMGIRKSALNHYIKETNSSTSLISDRAGNSLSSGGDNDIVLEILKSGWRVGYFPSLQLEHIIPRERMQVNYMAKLLNHTNKSWVQVLHKHRINPWASVSRYTLPFRKLKAWFTYRAWKNAAGYIKWQGACGLFDGLATINHETA